MKLGASGVLWAVRIGFFGIIQCIELINFSIGVYLPSSVLWKRCSMLLPQRIIIHRTNSAPVFHPGVRLSVTLLLCVRLLGLTRLHAGFPTNTFKAWTVEGSLSQPKSWKADVPKFCVSSFLWASLQAIPSPRCPSSLNWDKSRRHGRQLWSLLRGGHVQLLLTGTCTNSLVICLLINLSASAWLWSTTVVDDETYPKSCTMTQQLYIKWPSWNVCNSKAKSVLVWMNLCKRNIRIYPILIFNSNK